MLTLAAVSSSDPAVADGQSEIQRIETEDGYVLEMLDTRGEGESNGIMAASSASDQGYVVMLVRGHSEGIIRNAQNALLTVKRFGYDKVGLILTDENPAEPHGTYRDVTIMSRGLDALHLGDAGPNAITELQMIRVVRYVYDAELGPPPGSEKINPYFDLPDEYKHDGGKGR